MNSKLVKICSHYLIYSQNNLIKSTTIFLLLQVIRLFLLYLAKVTFDTLNKNKIRGKSKRISVSCHSCQKLKNELVL